MTFSNSCFICGNDSYKPLIDFGVVPCSGSFLNFSEEAYDKISLSFEFCSKCAFIRRRNFQHIAFNYRDMDRRTSHRASEGSEHIVGILREKKIEKDALIIEIGSNDGTFMEIISRAGFTNTLGIEPSCVCAELCYSKGYRVENVFLNESEALRVQKQYGLADVVICRHTLEHVTDILNFVKALRILIANDGILLMEVPDARQIIHGMRCHELWDEHVHNFIPENFTILLNKAAFRVDEIAHRVNRDAVNIFALCTPVFSQKSGNVIVPEEMLLDIQACNSFSKRMKVLRERIEDLAKCFTLPVICIGASHPQTNFLLFTGLGRYVKYLIDDDSVKIGCFAPLPRPTPIVSSQQAFDIFNKGTVVRMAFGYEDWMDEICSVLAARGMAIFDPLPVLSEIRDVYNNKLKVA